MAIDDENEVGGVKDIQKVNAEVKEKYEGFLRTLKAMMVHDAQVETLMDGAGYLTFIIHYEQPPD